MIRAGLVFFLVVTTLSSLAAAIGHEVMNPTTPGQIQFISSQTIWFAQAFALGVVTLLAVLIMMLAAWRRVGHPLLVGLVALIVIVGVLSLLNYLDMALSPHEGKRSAQWSAWTICASALACLLPACAVSYYLLRRVRLMAPLLAYDSGAVRSTSP